jgi:hypothetical protein
MNILSLYLLTKINNQHIKNLFIIEAKEYFKINYSVNVNKTC